MNTIRLLFLVALLGVVALAVGFGASLASRWTEHETAIVSMAVVGSMAACATPVTLIFAFVLWQAVTGGRRRSRPATDAGVVDGEWRALPPATPPPPVFTDRTGDAARSYLPDTARSDYA